MARGLAGLGEPLPGISSGQRRGGQRVFVHDRHHGRRLTLETGEPVSVEHLAEPGDEVRPDQRAQVIVPADQRYLTDHRLNATIDRRDDQDMAAGVAAAPDPDPRKRRLQAGCWRKVMACR